MRRGLIDKVARRDGGLTLVELCIAAAISLIAMVAILSMFIASSKIGVESYLRNRASGEARKVIDRLTTDARSAVGIDSSFGSYTAGAATLILKVPAVDDDGLPVDMDSKYDRIIYHQDSDNATELKRIVVPDASSARDAETRVIGSSANPRVSVSGTYSVQPDALGAFVIHYEFTSVQSRGDKEYERPLAGSIRLRNKV